MKWYSENVFKSRRRRGLQTHEIKYCLRKHGLQMIKTKMNNLPNNLHTVANASSNGKINERNKDG
jgi:hypothetical protein